MLQHWRVGAEVDRCAVGQKEDAVELVVVVEQRW